MSSKTKPLTMADVIPITQLSSHEYQVTLDKAWRIGTVPNGGYTTSAFLICARTHMQLSHPTRSCTDPINIHVEFIRRTAAGPGRFVVRDVKIGSRTSNLHLTLYQDYYETGESNEAGSSSSSSSKSKSSAVAVVEAYVMLSNIAAETGMNIDTGYKLLPPPLPADLKRLGSSAEEDDNYRLRGNEPYQEFRAAASNLQMYLVKPDRRPASQPLSVNDQWSRFTPLQREGRWTNDSLGFVVDMFPQFVERYRNPEIERATVMLRDEEKLKQIIKKHAAQAAYWYPTLTLNLDVKKALPAEGVEWLFTRTRPKALKNGRFDLDVEVWDAQGELVATSSHASLVLSASRNMTRNGKEQHLGKL